ncbi:hypothetical protein A8C56_13495 [Niabella ginsenosidivorans]|uniref:Neutral/alkaline non-lysosomal ceramidase N-terminal domain-containing protein n=1 Tax=Niabella ginsenosidivorans TaxID=1176587 RepID=A0A1A9I3F2_9BACT|nr:hypothetical protein [Niabella ginsenosidivorans]ANH81855.1 hypothetical protein A8C56_13495 [Niabella ginsenosidivorans]
MSEAALYAGTFVTDITPPLEIGLLTSSVKGTYAPFESVRTPLKARVLVLQSGTEKVAIVSLDLLSLTDTSVGGWDTFKQGMAGTIPAEKIVLCCTHTHSAPESGGLTGLYQTDAFKSWIKKIQTNIREATEIAADKMLPCELSAGVSLLEDHAVQRRVKTPEGIVNSDSLQPLDSAIMNGQPVDRRVKWLQLNNKNQHCVATVVQAVCHPVHEMCIPRVSADFPGELCAALERTGKNGVALFLNGAAGNINPPTVSMGAAYSKAHGMAMAALVENGSEMFLESPAFSLKQINIPLSIRNGSGITNSLDAVARISLIHFGTSLAVLFLPGEIFVETALEIERQSPFEQTLVAGFSENNIGYVPTVKAFEEGGYETGPGKWSFLEQDACERIQEAAIALLQQQFYKTDALLVK